MNEHDELVERAESAWRDCLIAAVGLGWAYAAWLRARRRLTRYGSTMAVVAVMETVVEAHVTPADDVVAEEAPAEVPPEEEGPS